MWIIRTDSFVTATFKWRARRQGRIAKVSVALNIAAGEMISVRRVCSHLVELDEN